MQLSDFAFYFFILSVVILTPICIHLMMNVEKDRVNQLKNSSNMNKAPRIFSINFEDADNGQADIDIQRYKLNQYFDALSNAVSRAQHSIYVLDYVEHGREMEQTSDFSIELRKAYERYFQKVEEVLKSNSKVIYTRILQLPLDTQLEFQDDTLRLKYALDHLYSPTRKHIDSLISLDNFHLYVVPKAIRSISEIVIDRTLWFIEIDRYGGNGTGKPDRLLAYEKGQSMELEGIIEDEVRIINLVLSNYNPVTRDQLTSAVRLMKEDLKIKEDVLKSEKKELEQDFTDILAN